MHNWSWGVAIVAGLIAGCSDPSLSMPEEPPQLSRTDDYSFGDRAASHDTKAWTAIWDRAKLQFGDGLRLERRIMAADVDWRELQTYYDDALPDSAGWTRDSRYTTLISQPGWSFARTHDDHIFAVVGLRPEHAEGGLVPVNVITNLRP